MLNYKWPLHFQEVLLLSRRSEHYKRELAQQVISMQPCRGTFFYIMLSLKETSGRCKGEGRR